VVPAELMHLKAGIADAAHVFIELLASHLPAQWVSQSGLKLSDGLVRTASSASIYLPQSYAILAATRAGSSF